MKHKLFTLVWLLNCICAFPCTAENAPIASFDKTTIDFGEFSEDNARHKAVFTIKNTGNAPLIIINVRATCGCTTPTFTKAPIMPGKTGSITVEYNGHNRAVGPFSKSIFVKTNATPNQTRLQLQGNMQPTHKTSEISR